MNFDIRKVAGRWAALLALGLLCIGEPAFSKDNCNQATGKLNDVYIGGNTASGRISGGGLLHGTTLTVFTSGAFSTPVPTTVSFTADLTVTTNQGQLKTTTVDIYDFQSGLWTRMARINPNTSTGRFARATGVLYFNGRQWGALSRLPTYRISPGKFVWRNNSRNTPKQLERGITAS